MKLLITVVQDTDSDYLIDRLTEKGFRVTILSSTGGFLKSGNTTILTGIEEDKLGEYLEIVKNNCKRREVTKTIQSAAMPGQNFSSTLLAMPVQVVVGGAPVFILDAFDFKKY